jgi:hypothetical protein
MIMTMTKWIEIAVRISNQWNLAAFGVAAILFIVLKVLGRKMNPFGRSAIIALALVCLVPTLASTYVEITRIADRNRTIYHVRTIVLGPTETPIEDTKVWSSASGEPKRITGGWQFDIPEGSKPLNGKLTIYASVESAFLTGKAEMQLGEDRNPTVTIVLRADTSANVRGIIVDGSGNGVFAARVLVVGYENEAVVTGTGGSFSLPAHAASGQMVRIHVQKNGYAAANEDCPAGDSPATIVMNKAR